MVPYCQRRSERTSRHHAADLPQSKELGQVMMGTGRACQAIWVDYEFGQSGYEPKARWGTAMVARWFIFKCPEGEF